MATAPSTGDAGVPSATGPTADAARVPPPTDRTKLPELNAQFDIRPEALILGDGWRERLGRFIARRLAPVFARQFAFNSALVEHLNRQAAVGDAIHDAGGAALAHLTTRLGEEAAALAAQLDAAVQRLDVQRDAATERIDQRLDGQVQRVDQRIDDLQRFADEYVSRSAATLDAFARQREPLLVADERRQQVLEAVLHAQGDLRASIAVLQQSAHMLTRELDRLRLSGGAITAPAAAPPPATAAAPATTLAASSVESYKYVGFEDRFRGSADEIRSRQLEYAGLFAGASDVLDVGCGRGEFLEVLRDHGITARGLDLNHAMVETCLARGLDVTEADALGHLESLAPGSLGGLMAAQVVEHFQPDYLLHVLSAAYGALRPGSAIVLETINPACWFAFFESYIRDITHVRPLHPDTLSYLLTASGFQQVEVRYKAPYPDREKLQPIRWDGEPPAEIGALVDTVNGNVDRVNRLLFTHLDYAAIGRRL